MKLKSLKLSYDQAEKDLEMKIKEFCRYDKIEKSCDIMKLLRTKIATIDNP